MIDASRLSDRTRSWMMAGIALCGVLIFLSIWTVYAGAHVHQRYRQLPPGATATVKASTFRVLDLKQTGDIANGEESKPAQAGTVWVIATMELNLSHAVDTPGCTLTLVGDGNRTWDPVTDFFDRSLPQYCGDYDHPITVGKPWKFEQVFQVPIREADSIYGVAASDGSSAAPTEVIRPA